MRRTADKHTFSLYYRWIKFTFNVKIVYICTTETVPFYFKTIFERGKNYAASILFL